MQTRRRQIKNNKLPPVKPAAVSGVVSRPHRLVWWLSLIVAVIAFVLYANTLTGYYLLDDSAVTRENKVVMQGVKGIPDIWKTAYWYGFNGKNDTNYRPLSLTMFAIEWSLSPGNPFIHHLLNVLLYALTGFCLCLLMFRLTGNTLFSFVGSLLYVTHPLHTEVVASIKSRDDILCFLLLLCASLLLFRYLTSKSFLHMGLALLSFLFALFSKESALTWVAVVPLLLWFFSDESLKKKLKVSAFFLATLAGYIFLRQAILGKVTGEGTLITNDAAIESIALIDNTLAGVQGLASRLATAVLILGKYLKLLVFPHPLCYDYSYAQIPFSHFSDTGVLFSLALHVALLGYALSRIPKKDPVAFGILFYFITISLVSNTVLLIKATMAERLLYIPSFGFALAVSCLFIKLFKSKSQDTVTLPDFFKKHVVILSVAGFVCLLFSMKTVARNMDWHDNHRLFSSALTVSPLSARVHHNYASVIMIDLVPKENDPAKKNALLDEAIAEYGKALKIYPIYGDAIRYLTQAKRMKDPAFETAAYLDAVKSNPSDARPYIDLGVYYGNRGEFSKAAEYLSKAVNLQPSSGTFNNLGNAYAGAGMFREALEAYKKALELDPGNTQVYGNMGSTYGNLKDFPNAIVYFKKAFDANPLNRQICYFVGLSYQNNGQMDSARYYFDKAEKIK